MSFSSSEAGVHKLLDVDPDDIPHQVQSIPFSVRSDYFRALINLLDTKQPSETRRKAAPFAVEILAGHEPILSESQAVDALKLVATLAETEEDVYLLRSLLLLSSLLSARVANESSSTLEAVYSLYSTLARNVNSEVAELSSNLAKRLDRRRVVFSAQNNRSSEVNVGRKQALENLDLSRAALNFKIDAKNDWLVDPWSWPEVDWLVGNGRSIVEERLNTNSSGYVVKLDVAKDNHSTRPALVMNPVDRLAYQCIVDKVSLELVGHLPSWVYGWRLSRDHAKHGHYSDNKFEWKQYTADLADKRRRFRYSAHLDIRSFFASVPPSSLIKQLLRQCRAYHLIERLEHFLYSWNSASSRTGLPQRFFPSSLLAQAYLRPLDDYLSRVTGSVRSERLATLRWVDDIWLFANSESELRVCTDELSSLLDQLGLEFNSEKTVLFDSNKPPKFLELVNTSGEEVIEVGTHGTYSVQDVDQQFQRLLQHAEDAPRPSINYIVATMLATQNLDHMTALESKLDDLPHVADHIARALRLTGRWIYQQDWYLSYLNRNISPTDWSIEAWGGMFPTSPEQLSHKLVSAFAEKLQSSLQTTVVPLVCHLLSSWRPELARSVFPFATFSKTLEYRALAFAGLNCQLSPETINEWLGATSDTSYLVDFLKSRNYRPFDRPSDDRLPPR